MSSKTNVAEYIVYFYVVNSYCHVVAVITLSLIIRCICN